MFSPVFRARAGAIWRVGLEVVHETLTEAEAAALQQGLAGAPFRDCAAAGGQSADALRRRWWSQGWLR